MCRWNKSQNGQDGLDGATGPTGAQGIQGIQGATGPTTPILQDSASTINLPLVALMICSTNTPQGFYYYTPKWYANCTRFAIITLFPISQSWATCT